MMPSLVCEHYCSFVLAKGGDAVSEVTEPNSVEVVVDVEGFFERECEMEAQVRHTCDAHRSKRMEPELAF
jgi:hypothetical protein